MELHQLEYVLAVATYQSFTRAAEEINISQSSLSQQIIKLENELRVSLFNRTTRSVQLTPAGTEFVKHAKRVLSELNQAQLNIQEYVSVEKGQLKIGIMPTFGYYTFHTMLSSFRKNFPGLELSLYEAECEELLSMVHESRLDTAIVSYGGSDSHLKFYPLVTDEIVLIASDLHPLSTRQSVEIKELKDETFIVPPTNSGNYRDFRNACQQAGFSPKILMHCMQVETTLALVQEGLGLTVLASRVAGKNYHPGLSIIPLLPKIKRRIHLALPSNIELTPALNVFSKYVRQWVNPFDNTKANTR